MTRLIGGRLVRNNVETQAAGAAADQALAALRGRIAACARVTGTILDGLEATDPTTRAKAVADWDRWLKREAVVGEARGCEESVAAKS